jgi:hypothetical protein
MEQKPQSYEAIENDDGTPSVIDYAYLESITNGAYRKFYTGEESNGNYEFNCRVFAMSVGADDVIRGQVKDGTNNRLEYIDHLKISSYADLAVDNKSDVSYMWRNMYGAIQAASIVVRDILLPNVSLAVLEDKFESDTARFFREFNLTLYEDMVIEGSFVISDSISQLLGEASFIRALSYFYLVRFFGDVPCYTDYSNSSGINGEVAISEQIPRTPSRDIYEKMIVRDLEIAGSLLPATSRSGHSSRPSKWAAKACLADAYMHMAGWPLRDVSKYETAALLCKEIIEQSSLSLTPVFEDLWRETTKTQANEHMFAIHHFSTGTTATSWHSNYGMSYYASDEWANGQFGWADYLLDSAFYEKFPSDLRKSYIAVTNYKSKRTASDENDFVLNWRDSKEKAPPIKKYRHYGDNSSPQSVGLTPIYRYAQVLLMYAEAANQAYGGPDALAEQCVRQIRERAGLTYSSVSGKDAFDELVFDEFGWEFAVEAKRWFQLVRKERVVAQNQFNRRVKASLDANGITSEAAGQTIRGYLFPIPTNAIDLAAGSGVTITQNPGY